DRARVAGRALRDAGHRHRHPADPARRATSERRVPAGLAVRAEGAAPPRLPRGRHGLTREPAAEDQRDRLPTALARAMAAKGYVGTAVTDVIKGAGVSRETFYQQFSSKLDCFLAAFDLAADVVVTRMADAAETGGTPFERVERAVTAYLDVLAAEPGFARLFL